MKINYVLNNIILSECDQTILKETLKILKAMINILRNSERINIQGMNDMPTLRKDDYYQDIVKAYYLLLDITEQL